MTQIPPVERDTVLIVDDVKLNRDIMRRLFADRYKVLEADNGQQALLLMEENLDRLVTVLLDVVMPGMDGLEVLRTMRERGWMLVVPVFLVTTESTTDVVKEGALLGVTDIIAKPFSPGVVLGRVSNAIELFRYRLSMQASAEARPLFQPDEQQIILMLRASLDRSNHLYSCNPKRIQMIVRLLLSTVMQRCPEYRLTTEIIDNVAQACLLYDIGKLTLPDDVLENQTQLTNASWLRIKEYPQRGCELLARLCPFLADPYKTYAYDICLHHHERFNGRGYPEGLRGDEISIWAQVVGMADAYDALVSKRPYRKAYSHLEAVEMIANGKCGVFSPALIGYLRMVLPQLLNYVYDIHIEGGREAQ